jgi:hypothetical protein
MIRVSGSESFEAETMPLLCSKEPRRVGFRIALSILLTLGDHDVRLLRTPDATKAMSMMISNDSVLWDYTCCKKSHSNGLTRSTMNHSVMVL